MSDLVELITVPNKSAGGTSEHLAELKARIEANTGVTLNSQNDHFICFTVAQDALGSLLGDLEEKLIVEVNQKISAPTQPGPYSSVPRDSRTPDPDEN